MNKDMLVVLGVIVIIVGVLGYFYYNVSKGVAPGLLKEEAQTSQAQAEGGAKGTKTTTKAGQSPVSGSSGSPPDFASLFLKTKEFKATYDYYVKKVKKGQITYYMKGDKRRMDISTDKGKIISIYSKDKTIFCMKQSESSQWVCYSLKAGQKPPQQQEQSGSSAEDPVEVSQKKFTKPVYNGTRKIAGKTCHCYYVKTTETQQGKNYKVTYEICVTTDGIFAYFYYKAVIGNQASVYWMVLKSYSTKVSDIAFNPPVQPQELPTSS